PSPIVIQGADFSATGKITNISNVPLCPGATPVVRLVNVDAPSDQNAEVVRRAFSRGSSRDVSVRELLRGRILEEPLSLTEAAALLDELRYERFRPAADGWEAARWKDLEAKVGIGEGVPDADSLLPFFRPPASDQPDTAPYVRGGPYAISAY